MHGTLPLLNQVTPSRAAEAIRTMRATGVSLYIHGGTGIAKSAIARQVANEENVALIDLRLSQLAPEDVRGVPMPGEVDRMKGIVWMPPLVFPRDLDFEGVDAVDDTGICHIRFFNPIGNNGVHYCTSPNIQVEATDPALKLEVERRVNSFVVQLRDDGGHASAGTIRWRVTGEAKAILALEEFNSATPAVMAAAYQLILDRRIGDYIVPDGVMLLALGNRDGDRGVTYQLPKPIANRFVHLEMEFSWDDWFAWAGKNHIHPEVVGYLSKWPSKVNTFDPDSPHLSFSTPRSWEFVSKIISGQQQSCQKPTLDALICGAIGDATGNEFIQHRRFMAEMPDVADILDGKVTTFMTTNPQYATQISYSIRVQLCYELKLRSVEIERSYQGPRNKDAYNKYPPRQAWLKSADRAFAYAIDNFRPDVAIVAARLSVVVHRLNFAPSFMPRFYEFLDSNRDVIMV